MADRLVIEFQDDVSRLLVNLPSVVQTAVSRVVKKTTDDVFNRIKFATPRDTGKAAAGWQRRVSQAGTKQEIFNTVDYINVLEFGGYPVIPRSRNRSSAIGQGLPRGAAVLGGYPPGPRTQSAPGGTPSMRSNVSRQAPQGMVRKTLEASRPQFLFDLDEAVNKALAGDTSA